MARTIGLNLQLNGVTGVVKDIKTFEDELRKAKEDLKDLEIGSDLFIQLQQEIGLAETQLLSLITSTKRLTREREIEGIGKLGQGIASSFAAAQASIALFGNETEEVSKAAAQAQNLLTLALSARGLAEIKLGAQLVARTIAQRAATAADVTQIAVLKQLYAVIAANPYGALLTVLGLLVAAYLAFGDAEEEVTEKTKTLNEILIEQESAVIGQIETLKILSNILFDVNSSLDVQEGAYIKLQKLVPELSNLTLEQARAQGILNSAIQEEITLIELRAEQKALEEFLVQLKKEEIQKRRIKEQNDEILVSIESYNTAVRQGFVGTFEEYEKQQMAINGVATSTKGLSTVTDDLAKITEEILKLESEQRKRIEAVKKATDSAKKSNDNRSRALKSLAELLKQQIKLQGDLLFQEVELGEADATIIKNLETRISKAQELSKKTNQLKTAQQLLNETEKEIAQIQDEIGDSFTKATEKSENFFNVLKKIDPSEPVEATKLINKGLEDYKNSLNEIRNSGPLTPELEAELRRVENIYTSLVSGLKEFVVTDPPFNVTEWEKTLVDFSLKTGKILTDPYERTQEEIEKSISNAEERYNEIRTEFITKYAEVERQKRKKELDLLLKDRVGNATEIEKVEKQIADTSAKAFENLEKQGTEILKFEDGIRKVGIRAQFLNNQLKDLGKEARLGFIVENAEEIANEFQGVFDGIAISREELSELQEKLRKKDFSVDSRYSQLLTKLQQKIGDEFVTASGERIDITELEYEDRLALLEKFLNNEITLIESSEDKKNKIRQQNLKDIQDALQMFSNSIGEIASIEAQFAQLRLDKLEQESQKSLEQVVGDSEESAKKREEIEEQFQAKKAEIEKSSMIKSLEFQLIQATADAAAAVVANLSNPVLATIAGVLGAAQVAVIAKQLDLARSAAGGMLLSGPSHEMGGIKMGGGLEVEGGESIINRVSTVNYQGLLSSINQAGGGQALINNASQSLMEERLVQAISKTRQQPIRAYVLNSEITNGQAINKRLEELSTL